MRQSTIPRRHRPDLLTRPPVRDDAEASAWVPFALDPVAPLAVLADLRSRGLISPHEYEVQKAKVIRPEPIGARVASPPPPCCGRPLPPRLVMPPRACGRSSSGGT